MYQRTAKFYYLRLFPSFLCLIFLFFGAGVASAQQARTASQADELEAVLQSTAITFEQAARFVISSSGEETSVNTAEAAFKLAAEKGWLPNNASPQDTIKLADLSFLITSAFNIEGGLMYKFFPGPRYAYRAMISRSLIQGAADPAMTVPGQWFLHILGNTINFTGGEQ